MEPPSKCPWKLTGHRSVEALCQYEHTSVEHVSNIMAGTVSNPPSVNISQVPASEQGAVCTSVQCLKAYHLQQQHHQCLY